MTSTARILMTSDLKGARFSNQATFYRHVLHFQSHGVLTRGDGKASQSLCSMRCLVLVSKNGVKPLMMPPHHVHQHGKHLKCLRFLEPGTDVDALR